MKSLYLAALVCCFGGMLGAETVTIQKDMLVPLNNSKPVLVTDEDGQNAMKVSGMLSAAARGNVYIDCGIRLAKPVDLSGKALVIRVQSDTPEVVQGFYVRAYNEDNQQIPVYSFQSWKSPLRKNYADLLLIPQKNTQFTWEYKVVTGQPAVKVNKFTFHAGSSRRGVEMSYKVKSIRIIELPDVTAGKFLKGIGDFGKFRRTIFTGNAQTAVEDNVLKITGTTPERTAKKGGNQYMDCSIEFKKPVSAAGKKLLFEYRFNGPVTGFHVRGMRQDLRTHCFSYASWTFPKEWTKAEIPLLKGETAGAFTLTNGFSGDLNKLQNLSFIFCSDKRDAPLSLEIRNLKLAE